MSDARALLTELFHSAVAGADPGPATALAVSALELTHVRHVRIVSTGKASSAMAGAAVGALAARGVHDVSGIVVTHDPAAVAPERLRLLVGDHPLPGRRSEAAAAAIADVLSASGSGTIPGNEADARSRAHDRELVLVLLSGGTSSLIAAPIEGVAPADLRQLATLLLASGLPIAEVNALRKRFARWGAGRLAAAAAPARVECLALSDVPGDVVAHIGSGPCSADEWTADALLSQLRHRGLAERIPASLLAHLQRVSAGELPETLKPGAPELASVRTQVIAGNRQALEAAARHCERLGVRCEIQHEPMAGEARAAGKRIALRLLQVARTAREPVCVVWGGETTVTLGSAAPRGGRAQELALSAARTLHSARPTAPVALLAAGTDGRDGTTDAAGAIVSATSWKEMQDAGATPERALAMHDAHGALRTAGLLLETGATGTNVMDVAIAIVGIA